MQSSPLPASPNRRVDLDWLRIIAFGLLIFYHVGMFYVTWDWHVKSSRASDLIEPLMRLTNPWRLLLLFVISGVATRFMLDRMKTGAFLGSRTLRLFVPLVFCILVIVPPQTYFEIVEKLGWSGSVTEFYTRYVTASGDWRPNGNYLITPTWNHLWFVVYLFVFTLLIAFIGPLAKRLPAKLAAPLVAGPALILLPWAALWLARATFFPAFGESHALIGDYYVLLVNFSGFLFGYAIAKHEAFFLAAERQRFIALGLAVIAWLVLQYTDSLELSFTPGEPLLNAFRGVRELQAWCAIIALFGFARRHLKHSDGPVRRYLTDAIFPFYIIHQTAIVIAGHYLDPLQLPVWIEAAVLIAITVGSCFLTYEIARRVAPLRPLFGLKLAARRPSPEPAPAT